jgi:hypothetical protein
MKLNLSISKEPIPFDQCLLKLDHYLSNKGLDFQIIPGDEAGTRGNLVKIVAHPHEPEHFIAHVIAFLKTTGYDVECLDIKRVGSDNEYSFQVQNQVLDILRA